MSLSTIPSIEDPAFKKAIEQYELKYQELKSRNQKLLDHIQTREKEYQREYEVMKQKLEANKFVIRDLEDKNLDLKYQVSALKKKEFEYQAQITKLKALVKVSQSQSEQGKTSSRSSLPNILRLSPDGQENASTANSDSLHMSPPDASEPVSRAPFLKRGSTVVLKLEEQMNEEEEDADKKSKNSHKIKSMTHLDSCHGTEIEPRSRLSVDCAKDDLRSRLKRKYNLGGDLDNAISEESPSPKQDKSKENKEKLSALKISLPSQEELPHLSPLKKKRSSKILHIENTKFKSSMGMPDDPEYVDKFNKLTQNIVSLGVKPEIANTEGALETVKSPVKTIEAVQSPDVARKGSLLKYTNIIRKTSLAMSPTSPMVRPWGSPTVQKVGRLFEDFFVIGPSQEDLATFIRENPDKNKGNLQPKILFSYPSNSSCLDQPPRTSIPDFAFPFGVDVRHIKSTPSFSGLNHIIYTSNDIEQRSKCFVFPLLSVNLDEDAPNLTLGQVIEASNPDHLFYIACINFKDFVTMTDHSQKEKTLDQINYWEVNKTMCFMSYYPFTNLFFDILMKIINLLKVERLVKVSQMNEKDLTRHEAVDMRFTHNYFETIVRKNLKNLLEAEVPNFDSQFSFKLQGGLTEAPIEFQLASSSLAHTFEASWACAMVFRYITYKDLLWFFTATLLERKLVFLSKNTHLLTATLFVLKSLIKPFKYPFPLIFNLPEVLMVYCDAPGAALIGINRGEEYLKEQNLFEDYPSCIYVCLDEQKLYMTPDNNVQQVQLSNFEKNLLTHYVKLNDKLKGAFVDVSIKNAVPQQAVAKSTESAEERQKSMKILELFKETLEKKILAHIPSKAIKKPDQNLDYDEIGKVIISKAKEVDKKFLREFVKTQIFIYYLEQHYEAATVKK